MTEPAPNDLEPRDADVRRLVPSAPIGSIRIDSALPDSRIGL